MPSDYDLHVATDWYLYCIGCDLLTKIQRTSQNQRLMTLSELWFRSSSIPLLRITYCKSCPPTADTTQRLASWPALSINRTLIEESKLWKRLTAEHNGIVPSSATGSFFYIENPNAIILSAEFTYRITDYGRDYYTLKSRYPALRGRDFGRFEALAAMDKASQGLDSLTDQGNHMERNLAKLDD